MYFWLKFFHITAVAFWFVGLFFLPRVFIAFRREGVGSAPRYAALGRTIYFRMMTPAAAVAIVLGLVLIAFDFHGAWLAVKLGFVAVAVLLHAYCGLLLADLSRGHARHGIATYRLINWTPLVLVLAIAALSGAKPDVF